MSALPPRSSPRGLPYTIALVATVIFAAVSILRVLFRAPSAGGESAWSPRSPPFERTSEGLEGERGAADWPVLRTALSTRLALHGSSVSIDDGRTGAGTGSRVLLVYARRGADADVGEEDGGGGGARADTLLLTIREADGRDVFAARTSFLGAGAVRSSPTPHSRSRGGGGLFGIIRRLWSGNMMQHGVGVVGAGGGGGVPPWPERHIPQGPSRGKAARAFGASARGHALASRQNRDGGPSLRIDLAVEFPRVSCCEASDDVVQTDAALLAAAPELAGKWPFVCADEKLRPCAVEGSLSRLSPRGFLQTLTAARALATAADASPRSARVISGAPLTAGELSWTEAITAALADAVRLNLAQVYTPTGAKINWTISTSSLAASAPSKIRDDPAPSISTDAAIVGAPVVERELASTQTGSTDGGDAVGADLSVTATRASPITDDQPASTPTPSPSPTPARNALIGDAALESDL